MIRKSILPNYNYQIMKTFEMESKSSNVLSFLCKLSDEIMDEPLLFYVKEFVRNLYKIFYINFNNEIIYIN